MEKIKRNMKRGISPLISYILIITLSVSIGFLVINALTSEVDKFEIDPMVGYCDDVRISVEGVCLNGSMIKVNVTSTGSFSVHKFSFGRVTNVSALQWCDVNLSASPLDFGIETIYGISRGADFNVAVDESTKACDYSYPLSTAGIAEIRVMPWIKPEGELISCKNKEVIIKEGINGNC